MILETVTLHQLPEAYAVYLTLFRDVTNCPEILGQLLARNPAYEYAFLDASVIVSRLHILSAVFRAITLHKDRRLKTPNVHSEIVHSLSMSSNISEAYKRFGVGPDTRHLLIVKVTFPSSDNVPTNVDLAAHIEQSVKGQVLIPTDANIASLVDWAKVRKYYKLGGLSWTGSSLKDRQEEEEMMILGSMAIKGV